MPSETAGERGEYRGANQTEGKDVTELPILTEIEVRTLGCLVEKAMTTPEQYPLTLNALKNACNQKSNRNPVVHYDEANVRNALSRLQALGLAKQRSTPGSYVPKYEHQANKVLEVTGKELAALCVLMLRGPQTTGEIRTRTQRMTDFPDLAEVERVLERLQARETQPLVVHLTRQAGQKESRYGHTLAGDPPLVAAQSAPAGPATSAVAPVGRLGVLEEEVAGLRSEVVSLTQRLATLERRLGVEDTTDGPGADRAPPGIRE